MANDDTTQSPPEEVQFLQEDLSQVKTDFPLIKPGLVDLQVDKVTQDENEAKTGYNLNVAFKTVREQFSTSDEVLQPGFPMYHTISLTKTPRYNEDAIKRNVAGFTQACKVAKLYPLDQFKDVIVKAKVEIRQKQIAKDGSGREFPEKNVIKQFVTS